MARKKQGSIYDPAFWGIPTTEPYDPAAYQRRSPDPSYWRKRSRPEEAEEVDADLRGRPTGRMFTSNDVPMSIARQQQRSEKQPEPTKKQQPRRNPDRTTKMQKKPPCKGGFTDRDISSPKLKNAVIAELRLLGPTSLPIKDQIPDAAGRMFHLPQELVIRGESKANLKCYLPALRFVSGLDKPLPTQVTKVLENADACQINMVSIITLLLLLTYYCLQALQPHTGLTLAKQTQLHNNWLGLLSRDAGCYMLVGKAGPMWNHWIVYNAWTGVLYDGGDIVRIVEDADRDSTATAKTVFTDELQLDDLREVYVVKTYSLEERKKETTQQGTPNSILLHQDGRRQKLQAWRNHLGKNPAYRFNLGLQICTHLRRDLLWHRRRVQAGKADVVESF